MTTLRLPSLPSRAARLLAAELHAAARCLEATAGESEAQAREAQERQLRVRAALEARRSAHARRVALIHRLLLQAGSTAAVAALAGVSARQVERTRAAILARL